MKVCGVCKSDEFYKSGKCKACTLRRQRSNDNSRLSDTNVDKGVWANALNNNHWMIIWDAANECTKREVGIQPLPQQPGIFLYREVHAQRSVALRQHCTRPHYPGLLLGPGAE